MNDRTALVTASTRGIGKAIGVELLKAGYYVIFNYAHSDEAAGALKQELSEFAGSFSIVKADLSDFDEIETLVNGVLDATSVLDCVILNTGATCRTPFMEMSRLEWWSVINTNLSVPFFTLQALDSLLPYSARIILIGALMGELAHAVSVPYAVSKAGLHMLAKSLVKHYKPFRTTINVIAPGFVDTEWHDSKDPVHKERVRKKIALRRFGQPVEVAKACLSVIENEYINGAVIHVDGGYDME